MITVVTDNLDRYTILSLTVSRVAMFNRQDTKNH